MKEVNDPQITQISFFGLTKPAANESRSGSTNAANSLMAIYRTEKSA
jgi:hypothetical protein